MTVTRRGPGRRRGPSDTRAQILAAARGEFAAHGYDGATIRRIAQVAGVDPALVHHYFGGKEQVFVAALELPFAPTEVVAALVGDGGAGVGERAARFFFDVWSAPASREPLLALLRSAMTNDQAAALLREFVTRAMLSRLAAAFAVPAPRLRVELAVGQLIGVAVLRYVIKVEPLASASDDEVVALLAPTIERYLTAPL